MMDEKGTFCDEGTKNKESNPFCTIKFLQKTHFEKLKLFAEKKT